MKTKLFLICIFTFFSIFAFCQNNGVIKKTSPTNTYENINNIAFKKENLGTNVNSKDSELGPLVSPDGNTLYFTRSYYVQSILHQEAWYCELDNNGNWKPAQKISSFDDFEIVNLQSITPDGSSILLNLTNNDTRNERNGLYISYRTAMGWGKPEKLKIKNIDKLYRNAYWQSAFLSNSGKVLTIDLSKSSNSSEYFNKTYISFLNSDGSWTEPRKLSNPVNTIEGKYGTFASFIASDNVTLYFASDRDGGFGNCDIYYSKRLDDTWLNWSEPVNMGADINTSDWDAYYSISAKGDYAYLVSSQNSYGESDIFRVKLKEEDRPNPVVLVSGKVINPTNNKPLEADIYYYSLKDGSEVGRAKTNPSSGIYKIALPYGYQYSFIAKAVGYYSMSNYVDLTTLGEYKEMNFNIEMKPIEVGETFTINNIFFDFNKSSLKSESFFELDRVVKLLSDNPTIEIELSGHTDNIGSDDYNKKLSYERANSVAEYLTSKGIQLSRINVQGYGKSKPVGTNETEEGRQLNRRVEFQILKK